MKTLNLAWIALLFVAATLTSCGDDLESSSLTLDNQKKASLKAYIYAELDITKPGLEVVPSGSKVVISAPYSSFNPSATGVWTDTLFTNAEGIVESDVTVSSKGTTYTIKAIDFESNQIQEVSASQSIVAKIFESTAKDIELMPLAEEVVQIKFTAKDYDNYVELINIDFYLNGEFNEAQPGDEVIPPGTVITFQSPDSKWSTSVTNFETVTVEGDNYSKATISVKKGDKLEILDFVYNKTLPDNSQKSHIYFLSPVGPFNEHNAGYRYTLENKENLPYN